MNNKKQKNIVKNFSKNTEIPYSRNTNVIYQDGITMMSETLNNTFQQLLDNDKYTDANLTHMKTTYVGPKPESVDPTTQPNGFKFWSGINAGDDLNILQKIDEPIQKSVELNSILKNHSINFIIYVDNNFMIGTDHGLYYSANMKDINTYLSNGTYDYMFANQDLYVCSNEGIYKYVGSNNTFTKVRAISNCRSISMNETTNVVYIGTTDSAYRIDFTELKSDNPLTPLNIFDINDELIKTTVNDFTTYNNVTYAATANGLYTESIKSNDITIVQIKRISSNRIVQTPYATYVTADTGLYKISSDSSIEMIKSGKTTDICYHFDTIYFSTQNQIKNERDQIVLTAQKPIDRFDMIEVEGKTIILFLEEHDLNYAFLNDTSNIYSVTHHVNDFAISDNKILYVVSESDVKRYQISQLMTPDTTQLTHFDKMQPIQDDSSSINQVFQTSANDHYILVSSHKVVDVDVLNDKVIEIFGTGDTIHKIVNTYNSKCPYIVCTTNGLFTLSSLTQSEFMSKSAVDSDFYILKTYNVIDAAVCGDLIGVLTTTANNTDYARSIIVFNLSMNQVVQTYDIDSDSVNNIYAINDKFCIKDGTTIKILDIVQLMTKKAFDKNINSLAYILLDNLNEGDNDENEIEIGLSKCNIFLGTDTGLIGYHYADLNPDSHNEGDAIPAFETETISEKHIYDTQTIGDALFACTESGIDIYNLTDSASSELIPLTSLDCTTELPDLSVYDFSVSQNNLVSAAITQNGLYEKKQIKQWVTQKQNLKQYEHIDNYDAFIDSDDTLEIHDFETSELVYSEINAYAIYCIAQIDDVIIFTTNAGTKTIDLNNLSLSPTNLENVKIQSIVKTDNEQIVCISDIGDIYLATLDEGKLNLELKVNGQEGLDYRMIMTYGQYILVKCIDQNVTNIKVFSIDILDNDSSQSMSEALCATLTDNDIVSILKTYYNEQSLDITDIEPIESYASKTNYIDLFTYVCKYRIGDAQQTIHCVSFDIEQYDNDGEISYSFIVASVTDIEYENANVFIMNNTLFLTTKLNDTEYSQYNVLTDEYSVGVCPADFKYAISQDLILDGSNSIIRNEYVMSDFNWNADVSYGQHIAYMDDILYISYEWHLYSYDGTTMHEMTQSSGFDNHDDIVRLVNDNGILNIYTTKSRITFYNGEFNYQIMTDETTIAHTYVTDRVNVDNYMIKTVSEEQQTIHFSGDLVDIVLLSSDHNHGETHSSETKIIDVEYNVCIQDDERQLINVSSIPNMHYVFQTNRKTYVVTYDIDSNTTYIYKTNSQFGNNSNIGELVKWIDGIADNIIFNNATVFYLKINDEWHMLKDNVMSQSNIKSDILDKALCIMSDTRWMLISTNEQNSLYRSTNADMQTLGLTLINPILTQFQKFKRVEISNSGNSAYVTDDHDIYEITKDAFIRVKFNDTYGIESNIDKVIFEFNEHNRVNSIVVQAKDKNTTRHYRIVNEQLELLPASFTQKNPNVISTTLNYRHIILSPDAIYRYDDTNEPYALVQMPNMTLPVRRFADSRDGKCIFTQSGVYVFDKNQPKFISNRQIDAYCLYVNDEICNIGNMICKIDSILDDSFTNIFEIPKNAKVNCIYKKNEYEYFIGTNLGIFQTKNIYTTRKCISKFGVSELYDLENEMLNSVISYISSHITTHINNEHNSNSVMSYINSNCVSTDFSIDFKPYSSTNKSNEKIIVNDIIETFISFDHTAGLIDIAVENTISSQTNVKHQSIIKQWKSGLTELYVNIPTTNTYYLDHNDGDCAYDQSIPFNRDNTSIQTTSTIKDNYTRIQLTLHDKAFNIDRFMSFDANGQSLPLKIYKDTKQYGTDDTMNSEKYHSVILPTVAAINTAAQTDRNTISLACFGSDAQAIRFVYDDSNKMFKYMNDAFNLDKKFVRIVYHSNNQHNDAYTQLELISKDIKSIPLRSNKFESTLAFTGWAISANGPVKYNQDDAVLISDMKDNRIDVYAVWLTQFEYGTSITINNE